MSQVTLRAGGRRHVCLIEQDAHSIYFRKSPFPMKDEIKCMKGAKWNPEIKQWSVDRHPRNLFQLRAMMVEPINENPYAWFERPLIDIEYERPLAGQQVDMLRRWMTYHYQIAAADMGLGKSLTALELIERNPGDWIFVGPKSALESVELDKYKWKSTAEFRPMTYERFRIEAMKLVQDGDIPLGVIFDECTGIKTPNTANARTAQALADAIRSTHGLDGFVIAMSGTTTAKRPSDIWSQCEVVWPGFLREGSLKAFEARYANIEMMEDADGNRFPVLEGWKDEEVSQIPARTKGLVTTYFKEDWLTMPERTFEVIELKPTPRIKRVAKALVDASPNVITALTWLRALSSGFQYNMDEPDAEGGDRAIVETACPKDDAMRTIFDQEEHVGRMITFASFQGSIDRVKRIAFEKGWDVVQIDGRGWLCFKSDGTRVQSHVLDFWSTNANRTVVVGNPASCRFGLTLIEAKTTVYFDQGFSAEHRLQSMDRNYRMGQKDPVRVIDLLHLDVDRLVLDTLMENGRLEDLSLGRIREQLGDDE